MTRSGIRRIMARSTSSSRWACRCCRIAPWVRADEYDEWDLFVYMDDENERHLSRIFGGDPEAKRASARVRARCGAGRRGRKVLPDAQDARAIAQAGANAADVADPWFTGNFDDTYRDVLAGCKGLLTWCRAQ